MKYKPSALVETMSGSQGDSTFSTGRAGDYIRRRVDPAQPRTQAQSDVRARFSQFSSQWKTLTAAQRLAWSNLAGTVTLTSRYGSVYHPSGQQLFVRANSNLGAAGVDPITDAPGSASSPGSVTDFNINVRRGATAATDVVTVTAADAPAGSQVEIYATAPFSPGREYVSPSSLRLVAVIAAADMGNVNSIRVQYENKFGRPVLGTKVKMQAVPIGANGIAGPPSQQVVIVIAV